MVPSRVKQDQRLRAWDFRVLLAVLELSHWQVDGESLQPVTVRARTLARMSGDASQSAREMTRRSLIRLEEFGYLTRQSRPGKPAAYDPNPTWGRPPIDELPPEEVRTTERGQRRTDNPEVGATDNPAVVTGDNRGVGTNISESSYSYKGQAERAGLSAGGLKAGLEIASQILGHSTQDLESWWVRETLNTFTQMPRARHPDGAFRGFITTEAQKRAEILRPERTIPQL
ncbi:MAG: hypothetical protein ACE149_14765 [Armatimonadota bacterium]